MALRDVDVRNAKGNGKPYKLADSGGLYALVQPNGARLWRYDYRFGGKRKTLAFGTYPVVSLADARARRDAAKKQIVDGVDPSVAKREERVTAAAVAGTTFSAVAEEYLTRFQSEGAASATLTKKKWMLRDIAGPQLGQRPIHEITPADILAVLQSVERSGRLETARRLRSAISAVFCHAVVTLRAPNDPTLALRGATQAPRVESRAATTDPKALGKLMNQIDVYRGSPMVRCALLFTALTAARPGEVRCAEWSEIDVEKATWTIPAQRTKMRREHDVPLSRQALAVIEDVRRFTGRDPFVFSTMGSALVPLSENAMNTGLRAMGVPKEAHTAHGFRSSFSTIMNDRDENPDDIELCLAHQHGDRVRSAYNRAKRWPQRVAMMQLWADLLDEFRRLDV